MPLLLRAAGEVGVTNRCVDHVAGSVPGTVRAVSPSHPGKPTWVAEWLPGEAVAPKDEAPAKACKTCMKQDLVVPRVETGPHTTVAAVRKSQSPAPLKNARVRERLAFESVVGPVRRRVEWQMLRPGT